MQGTQACQALPMAGVRLLYQRHAAKAVMRLFHVSLRTERRWLAKGFVPARVVAWALPIIDAEIERRAARLEALHREIVAAEAALASGPNGARDECDLEAAPAQAIPVPTPED